MASAWPSNLGRHSLLATCVLLTALSIEAKVSRSHSAVAEFKRQQPCPATGKSRGACPGWIIDHKTALACGGADTPVNMQWQTVTEARAKDKWERHGCRKR